MKMYVEIMIAVMWKYLSKHNDGEKSIKIPFVIYTDAGSLLEK